MLSQQEEEFRAEWADLRQRVERELQDRGVAVPAALGAGSVYLAPSGK